ncbi:hypothetical protein V8G54_023751 [Vigna mungo]|uniref:FAD/NAD(P)-binding domain-containing protein n=1 Tax=Vigna mungo TaxID=3915 RepID=A0AAQ3N599_VIGMU
MVVVDCRKEYFEITWANLRSMVEPSFADRTLINHRDYLTNADIVTSEAVNITETEVLTADGRRIGYDYLVIATGRADSVPKTRSERLNQFNEGEFETISDNNGSNYKRTQLHIKKF